MAAKRVLKPKKPKTSKAFVKGEFKLPEVEERVLKFWNENHVFERSLKLREKSASKKTFVFYEGPPYANGKPGIHHVLARVVKDIILRFKSMRGYYVPRKAGWDTHGLPVEIAAEKALGLKSKKEIEKFGIERFNEEAKKAVWLYKDEWEAMTRRIGYWLDLRNAYVTYDSDYIETLWWTLKEIANRKLLYKGHKVVPWCTRCGTALSSHELAQGYKEVTDTSAYVKFKLKSGQKIGNFTTDQNTYILSWTTTPWTLPGNVALAVGEGITYFKGRVETSERGDIKKGEVFIFAESPEVENGIWGGTLGFSPHPHEGDYSWANIKNKEGKNIIFDQVEVLMGKDLVGLEYEPLFPIPHLESDAAYKVYDADFVTTTDGTGVVHTAVMYGEDDHRLGIKVGLPQWHTVREDGTFRSEVPGGLAGMYAKDKETEKKVLEYLKTHGNFLRTEEVRHEYPHCWRCGTPLLYYARTSWFIAMAKLRGELLENNEFINWFPEHIKEGRFGEWLREAKDWNLSRERYWGTPLPVWECAQCGRHEFIGSMEDLAERMGKAKNRYWIMRHGEGENNIANTIDSGQRQFHLTLLGRDEAKTNLEKLRKELEKLHGKIGVIAASPVLRARETADIAHEIFGAHIEFYKELEEIHLGPALAGEKATSYWKMFPSYESRFERRPEGGESLRDLRARMWRFVEAMEQKHRGKNILVISHEYPLWMLTAAAEGWSERRAIGQKENAGNDFIGTAEIRELAVRILPRNGSGEADLHRPFVDEAAFECPACKSEMRRAKEVIDVWYDSGAMPYAELHYPFENKELIDKRLFFPADYIAEGIDQTRGWFYTLLAIATALGYGAPYKNVVSLGLINDKHGQKMSKSKGNIVEPMSVIQKFGVDAVRWYFYTVTPLGEPKNFDENEVQKSFRKFHMLVWNSLVFLKTYAPRAASAAGRSGNVLDRWIAARLKETAAGAAERLDAYAIREAALLLENFADDLSRWYIRRSRRRLQKPESKSDFNAASATLRGMLREFAKLAAPFTPFFAEALYAETAASEPSVHFENWPEFGKLAAADKKLIAQMAEVRRVASKALARRAELKIKVRQPLAALRVKRWAGAKPGKELIEILKDEINVKKIVFDPKLALPEGEEFELDTGITPELKAEGDLRELVRMIADLRQEASFAPKDPIALFAELPAALQAVASANARLLKKETNATRVLFKKTEKFDAEIAAKFEGENIWLAVKKLKK